MSSEQDTSVVDRIFFHLKVVLKQDVNSFEKMVNLVKELSACKVKPEDILAAMEDTAAPVVDKQSPASSETLIEENEKDGKPYSESESLFRSTPDLTDLQFDDIDEHTVNRNEKKEVDANESELMDLEEGEVEASELEDGEYSHDEGNFSGFLTHTEPYFRTSPIGLPFHPLRASHSFLGFGNTHNPATLMGMPIVSPLPLPNPTYNNGTSFLESIYGGANLKSELQNRRSKRPKKSPSNVQSVQEIHVNPDYAKRFGLKESGSQPDMFSGACTPTLQQESPPVLQDPPVLDIVATELPSKSEPSNVIRTRPFLPDTNDQLVIHVSDSSSDEEEDVRKKLPLAQDPTSRLKLLEQQKRNLLDEIRRRESETQGQSQVVLKDLKAELDVSCKAMARVNVELATLSDDLLSRKKVLEQAESLMELKLKLASGLRRQIQQIELEVDNLRATCRKTAVDVKNLMDLRNSKLSEQIRISSKLTEMMDSIGNLEKTMNKEDQTNPVTPELVPYDSSELSEPYKPALIDVIQPALLTNMEEMEDEKLQEIDIKKQHKRTLPLSSSSDSKKMKVNDVMPSPKLDDIRLHRPSKAYNELCDILDQCISKENVDRLLKMDLERVAIAQKLKVNSCNAFFTFNYW